MGSVKDLRVLEAATADKAGRGRFAYSDRYSVFDWGEMPDMIPHKGASIAILGGYFFEKLAEKGVQTHYLGLVENGEVKKLSDLKGPSDTMEIKLLQVLRPKLAGDKYDYSIYKSAKGNFLIPLEVIYRNSLPAGSSVFKRLEKGEITPADLGLSSLPVPDQKLSTPVLDVSTKLEITDRYMSWKEAAEISGMSVSEIDALKALTLMIDRFVTEEFARIGLVNEDGKIELGFDEARRLTLVDVFGTLDECRFTYKGIPVSKEIARIHYRDSAWHKAVEEAKKKDRQNWKKICTVKPEPLPAELKKLISNVYCSCTNTITGREWFKGVPPLGEILKKVVDRDQD